MSTATNKAIVSRYFEQVWNQGRLDLIDEFMAEEVVEHGVSQIPGMNGRDSLKTIIGGLRQSLPDVKLIVQEMIAEGDKVVISLTMKATHQGELMGIPATGKQLNVSGVGFFRLAGARIVEIRNFNDNLGLMQQLGVVPVPEAG